MGNQKSVSLRWNLWSLLTVSISVPIIKPKASEISASEGMLYRLGHRNAYFTTSAI